MNVIKKSKERKLVCDIEIIKKNVYTLFSNKRFRMKVKKLIADCSQILLLLAKLKKYVINTNT